MQAIDQPCDVLILTARYGAGHDQAALAVQEGLEAVQPGCHVAVVDFADLVSPLMSRITRFSYVQTVKHAPSWYGWFYEVTREIPRDSAMQHWLNRIGRRQLDTLLATARPWAVVCTYTNQAAALSHMRGTGRCAAPVFIVITDHAVHSQWVHPHIDGYFCSEEVIEEVARRGAPRQLVYATGIPVRRPFWRPVTPSGAPDDGGSDATGNATDMEGRSMLADLGLQVGIPTLLVMPGAFGMMSGSEEVCRVIAELPVRCQAVFVAGWDRGLHARLQRLAAQSANPLRVVGFTRQVAGLMAASDLIIGKAGGITTSEALASGLPLLVYRPIPGQEAENCAYLSAQGAAAAVYDKTSLAATLAHLLRHPVELDAMRSAARRLARPHAAVEIARHVLTAAASHRQSTLLAEAAR